MRVTMQVLPGGAWEATNVTLESMIRMAYRLQESQLVGGPAWIYSDRSTSSRSRCRAHPAAEFALRMQSLLAERFNLKLHNETRDLPVYALVMARGDEPRAATDAVDRRLQPRLRAAEHRRDRRADRPLRPGERPTCGTITGTGPADRRRRHDAATGADALAATPGAWSSTGPGSTGSFDYDLEFAPIRLSAAEDRAAGSRRDRPRRERAHESHWRLDLHGGAGATRLEARLAARAR